MFSSAAGRDPAVVVWQDLGVDGATDTTARLPAGTVTLLLADVEGSTRLWHERGTSVTDSFAELDAVVDAAVLAHHGVRPAEQGEGDSFVAAFAKAPDALVCALGIQQALVSSDLRLRMALHTGDVELRDGDRYLGPTLNRCARIRNAGHGGQVLLSETTRDLVVDRLPDATWLEDLG